ncbi:NnrS family protein [Ruegeria sp. MALMAid1280]|uniref:NnrS family protein n=1 Tax=Ruegeria sp. MALMAid1280 TaxID=3411634 RepID=UPI003BA27D64
MTTQSFWSAPYRPMFSGAALWALICIGWWPLGVRLGLPAPAFEPIVLWHVHELLFGFAALAVGGYLLTALPNWVAKPPEQGAILKFLMGFWALGRLTTAMADRLPLSLILICNGFYFIALFGLLIWRIATAGAYVKAPFAFAMLALGLVEATYMALARSGDIAASLSLARAVLIGFAILIATIGVRAVPAFTNTWRQHQNLPVLDLRYNEGLRMITIALLCCGALALFLDAADFANASLILAALFLLAAMPRWRSFSTWRNPLLIGLHAAFLWLPLGLLLMGSLWFFPAAYPMPDALHVLTIGAISGMIMAFTGRAASHTSEGPLRAPRSLTCALALLWCAIATRLAAPMTNNHELLENTAALFWCVSWICYLIALRPALLGPAVRPVLSGRTPKTRNMPTNGARGLG